MRARNLEAELGCRELWIKNDAVNFPTLSFKDRVVSVALTKAREFGFDTVAAPRPATWPTASPPTPPRRRPGGYIFVPADLERGKILGTRIYGAKSSPSTGTYDEVNRLCTQIAFKYGWGFVNINLRPFYAEGSKTFGFEIAEQLGWRTPHTSSCRWPAAG